MRWHLSLAARVRLYGLQRKAAQQELQHTKQRQHQGGEQAEAAATDKKQFFFFQAQSRGDRAAALCNATAFLYGI